MDRKQTLPSTAALAAAEVRLEQDAFMRRFAESRAKLAADPYRPLYHFVSPESTMNDPNGLCFWQGRCSFPLSPCVIARADPSGLTAKAPSSPSTRVT